MDGMCRTRFRLCALAVGLVVLALPARSRTAFAWAAGDGYYSLINRHSGSALDVIGASTESGAAVIQYLGAPERKPAVAPPRGRRRRRR